MASSKKQRHGELAARLETLLNTVVQPGQRLLLGFSGGLDSCVLLHLLAGLRTKCGYELAALHVHHGLSPNADAWQVYCAQTAAQYQIPLITRRVTVPRDSGLGIEAAARSARYAALLAEPVDMVVLAHHQDDQAETLLLQLLRGAGVKGMAAMPLQAATENGKPALLRPLLEVSRAALERYAHDHGLQWIEDESNLDQAYDRNFLRHHVFPVLEQRFPASHVTLARSAAHFAEAASLLDEVAREDAVRWISHGRLNVEALRTLSEPRARNLLRYWLSAYLSTLPNTRRLHEIQRQLAQAGAEAMVCIEVGEGQVRRYRDEAWFDNGGVQPLQREITWRGEPVLQLEGGRLHVQQVLGAGIALARLADGGLTVRARRGGESLRLHPARPARSLKNLFQEFGIPAWQRAAITLIYCGDELVAVPGIGVASEWQVAADHTGLVVEWRLGEC